MLLILVTTFEYLSFWIHFISFFLMMLLVKDSGNKMEQFRGSQLAVIIQGVVGWEKYRVFQKELYNFESL
jgi:hypothetical protein